MFTRDGAVIPAGTPARPQKKKGGHYQKFAFKKGIIVDVVFPDDKRNSSGDRVEYVVNIEGQDYPNAVAINRAGAINNYGNKILKKFEKSNDGKRNSATFDENTDAEIVYCLFLNGNGDIPIIIGSAEHPRVAKRLSKDDELIDVFEFNGVEFKTDKDSNYTITQVGRKDLDGKIINSGAVGTKIKIFGNGDIQLFAKDNQIDMFDDGITIADKNSNNIIMKDGGVDINVEGSVNVNAENINVSALGDALVEATNAMIEAAQNLSAAGLAITDLGSNSGITNVLGLLVNLGGGGLPVARIGDLVVGVGNLGIPVVSNIVQGSVKVTSA
jgi:hypothetical protein